MKRIITFLVITAMLFSSVACLSSSSAQDIIDAEKKIAEQISSDLKNNNAEDTAKQSSAEKSSNQSAEASKSDETEKPKETTYTIEKEVIVDNDYCTITIANASAKKLGGVDFKFNLENKTEDKDIMFSIDDTAVNGWILPSFFAETVAASKKANETLSFSASDLKDCGLTSVDKLEFHLRAYDSNDWLADEFVDETFTIYPTGKEESEIISPERRAEKNEMIVVDDENCSFVILDSKTDSIWGYVITIYLENKTSDKNMMYAWEDVSVNGYMIDPFWATSISPGNKKISQVTFSSSKFEENDIDAVEEIEFELRIYDYDNWSANDFVKDVFTFVPAK